MLRSSYFQFGSPPYLFPVQNDFRLCRWKFYWIGQPQKHGCSFWNFFSSCPTTRNVVTSGLGGRHIYFQYKATSGCIVDNIIEQLDLENMGVAVGILFLAVLEVEISVGGIFPPHWVTTCVKNLWVNEG